MSDETQATSPAVAEEDLCRLMVDSHTVRFDGLIWNAFDDHIAPYLGQGPAIADLGCGPGLFLFDLYQRYPQSTLAGFDGSNTMLDFASNLEWPEPRPRFTRCDLGKGIPANDGTFDVVALNFVLHGMDYPFPVLADARRILNDGGFLWIYDWARRPLKDYISFWQVEPGLPSPVADPTLPYRLFPLHNRYTQEDWHHVLNESGLSVVHEVQRADGQYLLMILRPQGYHH